MVSYYQVLQVEENASNEEIKSSYYKLAMQYHPDRHPDNPMAEEYFKRINEAYQVLRDPVKRQWYNMMLQGYLFTAPKDPRKYGTRRYASPAAPPVYEDNDKRPQWLRVAMPGLIILWGLMLVFNNWFLTSRGYEAAKVFSGILMVLVSSYFFVNALYAGWLKKQAEGKLKFNPEARSLMLFILLLFLTVPLFVGLGMLRKSWQLGHYGRVTHGQFTELVSVGGRYRGEVLYYTDDRKAYTKSIEFNYFFPLTLKNARIDIKYSTHEPRIAQYRVRPPLNSNDPEDSVMSDSIFQDLFNKLNDDYDYFHDF
jgi:hypothetical protein